MAEKSDSANASHLATLQKHCFRYAIVAGITAAINCWYANALYNGLAEPLLQQLPEGSKLIATQITAPFMVPITFALFFTFLVTLPYLVFEFWRFIRSGLYTHEKRLVRPFLVLVLLLFYGGVFFAYCIICPCAIHFFLNTTPSSVTLMIDISHYSQFMLSLCGYTGLVFETPVVTFGLIQLNCVSIAQMSYFRKYVIVAAFIIGMLLTPPDVVSQILLALPMWGLYELGILTARYVRFRQLQKQNPT